MAIEVMTKEANSNYNLIFNNCGHAVSNTLMAIGLKGAYEWKFSPDGPVPVYQYIPPDPNGMYTNLIINNTVHSYFNR